METTTLSQPFEDLFRSVSTALSLLDVYEKKRLHVTLVQIDELLSTQKKMADHISDIDGQYFEFALRKALTISIKDMSADASFVKIVRDYYKTLRKSGNIRYTLDRIQSSIGQVVTERDVVDVALHKKAWRIVNMGLDKIDEVVEFQESVAPMYWFKEDEPGETDSSSDDDLEFFATESEEYDEDEEIKPREFIAAEMLHRRILEVERAKELLLEAIPKLNFFLRGLCHARFSSKKKARFESHFFYIKRHDLLPSPNTSDKLRHLIGWTPCVQTDRIIKVNIRFRHGRFLKSGEEVFQIIKEIPLEEATPAALVISRAIRVKLLFPIKLKKMKEYAVSAKAERERAEKRKLVQNELAEIQEQQQQLDEKRRRIEEMARLVD
jgi:hypothetical protein